MNNISEIVSELYHRADKARENNEIDKAYALENIGSVLSVKSRVVAYEDLLFEFEKILEENLSTGFRSTVKNGWIEAVSLIRDNL